MPRREAAGGSLVLRASGVLIVMKLALMYKGKRGRVKSFSQQCSLVMFSSILCPCDDALELAAEQLCESNMPISACTISLAVIFTDCSIHLVALSK